MFYNHNFQFNFISEWGACRSAFAKLEFQSYSRLSGCLQNVAARQKRIFERMEMTELNCPHCGFTDELTHVVGEQRECDHCGNFFEFTKSGELIKVAANPVTSIQVNSKVIVQADKVLLQSGAILPAYCIRTGVPVDRHEMVTKSFTWCPRAILLMSPLILVYPFTPLFIIAYFLLNKKCVVTFATSEPIQRRNSLALGYIAVSAAVIVGLAVDGFNHFPVIFPIQLLLVISCLVVYYLFIAKNDLSISAHQRGWFVVSGFSEEFIQRLLSE